MPESYTESENHEYSFPWLSEEEYAKAVGQLKLAVANYLRIFDMYGMGVHIGHVTNAIIELAEDFGMRVRGEDRPIDSKLKPIEY